MIEVTVLGGLTVERDGAAIPLPGPPGRLLGFLAVAAGPQDRAAVAGRLWPEASEVGARANLRTTLWTLRRTLGEEVVESSRLRVGLSPLCRVDLAEVRRLLDAGEPAAALARWAGELLPMSDDEWVVTARQELRERRLAALDVLTAQASARRDHAAAVRWATQRAALAPLDEPAHRVLLRALIDAGDRAAATAVGREFVSRLRTELGVAPTAQTRAVLAEVSGAPSAATRSLGRELPTMFGRRGELATLTEAWTAARAGRGRVVVVTGEGGIGKTRLVLELARRAENAGARVAVGAGIDIGASAPLAVWQELARELVARLPAPPPEVRWPLELGRLAPDLATGLRRTGTPPAVASPELERLRIFDALLRLVEWAAATRPVVLVAEDVHRADGASLALCAHVGRRIGALPVLLVLTRRDRPVRADTDELLADLVGRGVEVTEVELGPMSQAELTAVARSLSPLPDETLARLVAVADGNPLLATESVRALAAGDTAPPANLRTAVRAATRRLPENARELIEALAAAGRELSQAELAALDLSDRPTAEARALDCGLISRLRGGLGFRHALLAEAARVDLTDPSRRHEQVAHAIESAAGPLGSDRAAAEVARHLLAAGHREQAGSRWQRAAAHARSLGALGEAVEFLDRAVECRPEDAGPLLELAEVHGWLGQAEVFEAQWCRALALLPGPAAALAWARRGLVLRTVVCDPGGSLAAYRTAADLLAHDAPTQLRTAVAIGLAWGEASAGDPAVAVQFLDGLANDPRAADAGDAAEIENIRLMILTRTGRFAECEPCAVRAAAQAQLAGRPDLAYAVWLHTSCALAASADLDGALRCADLAVQASRGIPVLEIPGHAARAFVLSRLGRPADAMSAALAQLRLAERLDSAEVLATARHDAGLVALAGGDAPAACDWLGAALAEHGSFNRPAARLARAEALAATGAVEAATVELRAAATEPVRAGDQPWWLVPRMARVQGLIASAAGDLALARSRYAEALAAWRRYACPVSADELAANFLDLGRPPVVGLVEPAREIARLEAELELTSEAGVPR